MAHPKGGYKNASGERIPGTTTIIGRFKDSGALIHWAGKQGQRVERGEIEHIYDTRDQAASDGTLAHEMVEAHIRGEPLPENVTEAAQSAFNAYLVWESMTKLKVVEQEIQLVSEAHQFGGCPDAIVEINGKLAMCDWKTSNGVYPDYLIQLAAYDILWHENFPDRPLTGGYHLCRFAKTHADFSHHFWTELDDAKEQFLLFRRAYDIDKRLKKRA